MENMKGRLGRVAPALEFAGTQAGPAWDGQRREDQCGSMALLQPSPPKYLNFPTAHSSEHEAQLLTSVECLGYSKPKRFGGRGGWKFALSQKNRPWLPVLPMAGQCRGSGRYQGTTVLLCKQSCCSTGDDPRSIPAPPLEGHCGGKYQQ